MSRISLRHVKVSVDGKVIVPDLSLDVPRRALVGIVGPNGAGKTTLAKAILKLIDIESGEISLLQRPLTSYKRSQLAKTVSYLPQEAPVHWPISVKEVVSLGRFAHSTAADSPAIIEEAVTASLQATDTFELRDRSIARLSGGEYARVMLARTLAAHAPIMIVDEPIASLDPYHQLHVMEILRQYADEGNVVLAVLHDLTLAGRFCDRIVMMKDGAIVGDGPPKETLRQDLLRSTYDVETVEGSHLGDRYVIPWRRQSH